MDVSPLVGIIMGSQSDWPTLRHAAETLARLAIPHETRIVSAHRTPDRLREYANTARARGLRVIIAGAGGAAHLPGMCAAWTSLPVLGVPVESHSLKGLDSLLSIVQMPAGVPVGTLDALRAAQTLAVPTEPHDDTGGQTDGAPTDGAPTDGAPTNGAPTTGPRDPA